MAFVNILANALLSRASTLLRREANSRLLFRLCSKGISNWCWSMLTWVNVKPLIITELGESLWTYAQVKQVWSDRPQIWYAIQWCRKMTEQSALVPSVWFHCADDLSCHHRPRGSNAKTDRTENPEIPLLGCTTYIQIQCLNEQQQKRLLFLYCYMYVW